MEQNWIPSLAFVWRPENDGQPYHATADDPGGATSYGVTETTWEFAVAHGYVKGTLVEASQDQLSTVLRVLFWQVIRGDDLPAGVDMVVFNMAMVSGCGWAARLLQRALGVAEDGIIGPITVASAVSAHPNEIIATLTNRDEQFFAGLADAKWFLHGWDRRALACEAAALNLLNSPPAPTEPVVPSQTEVQAVQTLEGSPV